MTVTPSPKLTELPEDVLLQVLQWCDVKTILCMQKTCHKMDSLSLSRSLWNTKALETSPETTPSIPFYLKSSALSDSELRAAIVSPARSFARLLEGRTYYGRRKIINFPPLYTTTPHATSAFCIENVRVIAGGRFVVVNSIDVLHVIDVAKGARGTCIWSRTSELVAENDRRGRSVDISSFAVDMLEDGSFNLLMLCRLKSTRVNFLAEVHRIFSEVHDSAKEQRPVFVQTCLSRNDDSPCLNGAYFILPGEGFLTVTDWQTQRIVEVDLPELYSMTELLKLEVHGDHIFFVLRTFYAVEQRRYDYGIHAIRLSSLFDDLDNTAAAVGNTSTVSKVRKGLGDVDHAFIVLPHTDEHSLVSISRLTISSPSKPKCKCSRDSDESIGLEKEVAFRITVGGKFWLSNTDSVYNFFSLYVLSFCPSSPSTSPATSISPSYTPSTAHFTLEHFPPPLRHPLENSDQNCLISYASACPSFTVQNRGVLMHIITQPHLQMSFFLSMIGLDKDGELKFAEIEPHFDKVPNVEGEGGMMKTGYKIRVPVEQHEGSIVLMNTDNRSCEIWYPM